MTALSCPICGVIAAERAVWRDGEEIECPCCAHVLRVMVDYDGTDIWLVRQTSTQPGGLRCSR